MQLEVAFEHGAHALQKAAVGVQTRHLILVLVRHQLEQVARHRLCKRRLAKCRLAFAHPGHEGLIRVGIGGVLVLQQEFHPPANDIVDRLALLELQHLGRRH